MKIPGASNVHIISYYTAGQEALQALSADSAEVGGWQHLLRGFWSAEKEFCDQRFKMLPSIVREECNLCECFKFILHCFRSQGLGLRKLLWGMRNYLIWKRKNLTITLCYASQQQTCIDWNEAWTKIHQGIKPPWSRHWYIVLIHSRWNSPTCSRTVQLCHNRFGGGHSRRDWRGTSRACFMSSAILWRRLRTMWRVKTLI